MAALGADVQPASEQAGDAKSEMTPSGLALDQAIAAAKDYRRRATTTISLTHELHQRHGLRMTGASPDRLIRALEAILPDIGSSYAVPHGGGAAMVKEGKAILAALGKVHDAHQATLGKLSMPIRLLHEKKGLLYEELRRLARSRPRRLGCLLCQRT